LKSGNLNMIYPIVATSYIWVAFFSQWFLKEAFPVWKWGGIFMIIMGIIIITR